MTEPTPRKMAETYFTFLRWTACIMSLTCLMMFLYGTFFELPFLYYQNLPYQSLIKKYKPGDTLLFIVERCNRSNKKQNYHIEHWLHPVLSTGTMLLPNIMMPPVDVDISKGCVRTFSKVNIVPLNTPPGSYVLQGHATVQGRFQKFEVELYSEEFEVVAPEGKK